MINNLAADIYSDATGKQWTGRITRLLPGALKPIVVWERANMRSQWHAETAMEAVWNKLQASNASGSPPSITHKRSGE